MKLTMNHDWTSQSGGSIINLIIGMALTLIAAMGVQQFFIGSKQSAKALIADAELTSHRGMLLRQSLSDDKARGKDSNKCLELEALKVSFKPKISSSQPKGVTFERKSKKKPAVAILGSSDNYDIERLRIVQRSNIIGRDPGRVLADLELTMLDRGRKLTSTITIPMLLDLDDSNRAIDCNKLPTEAEICEKMNGTFNEKNAGTSACVL